jgi:hypothetical protein
MAQGDRRGKTVGTRKSKAFAVARNVEKELSNRSANIVVGEFLSELQSAIRFRMKMGQMEGDWVEEPERFYTDAAVFATEETVASQVRLQITVSLDASSSMWNNDIMGVAGPTFAALDSIIRASLRELPEGTVHYAPFIFHEQALKIPQSWIGAYTARVQYEGVDHLSEADVLWGVAKETDEEKKLREKRAAQKDRKAEGEEPEDTGEVVMPGLPSPAEWRLAIERGEIPANASLGEYKLAPFKVRRWNEKLKKDTVYTIEKRRLVSEWRLSGADTSIAPLFQAIKNWEEAEGDTDAVRLDIVITDGVFDQPEDVALASRLQEDRNGKLHTVLLNFLPEKEWSKYTLPERCSMYAVKPESLSNSIRTILTETINSLF